MNTAVALGRQGRTGRLVGYWAWAGLAALQVVWYVWWMPPPHGSGWPVALIALVPLLLPLLALRRPTRALLWAGILALFYFCHGVWIMSTARAPATVEILLSAALVCTLATAIPRRPRNPVDPVD